MFLFSRGEDKKCPVDSSRIPPRWGSPGVSFFREGGGGWLRDAQCRGLYEGWRGGNSIFPWADKGKCRSRDEEDESKEDLDKRKLRNGFEPLFVDFTKEGAIYIIFLLFVWFAIGITEGVRN